MSEVWRRDVRGADQCLLLAIADHANDAGTRIYPSIARLAWKTGMGVSSVKRRIAYFRDLGVLVVVRRGGGRGQTTEYRLDLSRLGEKPAFRAMCDAEDAP